MEYALRLNKDGSIKVVAYVDDIAVLVADTDLVSIQARAGGFLKALKGWTREKGIAFSSGKSQALTFKGNLSSIFSIPFGNESIVSVEKVRYLNVIMDKCRHFCAHIQTLAGKSDSFYLTFSRLQIGVLGKPLRG